MKRIAFVLLATFAFTAVGLQAQEGAKGIYRDRESEAGKTRNGIAYRIFLVRGEEKREVPVSYSFRSGDRFKLQLNLKDPAFVYVLNRTFDGDPKETGEKGITTVRREDHDRRDRSRPPYTQLFPAPGERPQKIAAGRYRDIPGDVLLRMDENPGLEKLMVIISDRELDLAKMYPGAIRGAHRPKGDEGESAHHSDSEDDVVDRLNKDLSDWASDAKTEGPAPGADDASQKGIERDTYTVGDRSKPFMAEITLHHYRD